MVYNLCWTTDIDYFFHMNNGKYFREMDFGRFDFYFRTGFSKYIQSQEKMYFVQHGASIRLVVQLYSKVSRGYLANFNN